MALTTCKISAGPAVNEAPANSLSYDSPYSFSQKPSRFTLRQRCPRICMSMRTRRIRSKECVKCYRDSSGSSGEQQDGEEKCLVVPGSTLHSSQALAEACRFISNDAKFVNDRARNDIILLSSSFLVTTASNEKELASSYHEIFRGIMKLNARARQDVAILGSGFLKLNARAREDTEKIDRGVKRKAERLQHIASIIKDRAQLRLKTAADKHWSDGALEADLRLADFRAKQRAMEESLMALEFVKNIHDMMVSKLYKLPKSWEKGSLSANDIMLEKNGKALDFFPGEVSCDRITAIQEAYWSMASAFSEADGIDYTDPEELELLIATLIDLDAMDGKSSASLLAECSSSPDVSTRQAVANALASAPSMWNLGNAGMGALQRLAEDSNPAIAVAASRAIYELKKQWEIEEGDNWRFMMSLNSKEETDEGEDSGAN